MKTKTQIKKDILDDIAEYKKGRRACYWTHPKTGKRHLHDPTRLEWYRQAIKAARRSLRLVEADIAATPKRLKGMKFQQSDAARRARRHADARRWQEASRPRVRRFDEVLDNMAEKMIDNLARRVLRRFGGGK